MSVCEKCLITGLVQGVFFRASTQQKALELGIRGYARNLQQGHVEVLACGTAQSVGHLKAWLWEGPPNAHVSDVKCTLVEDVPVPEAFEVR